MKSAIFITFRSLWLNLDLAHTAYCRVSLIIINH